MKLRIIWSEFAEYQVDKIYQYYEENASPKIAKEIIKEIINEPNKLIKNSLIGQEEYLLKERIIKYRYLVIKSYKLIYFVDNENGFIKITDVFDTRQNPTKMKRTE